MSGIRPIVGDPAATSVLGITDVRDVEWLVPSGADFESAAVEAMKESGGDYQRLIAVVWPGRVNNSSELRTVRMLMDAESAVKFALAIVDSASWLVEYARREAAGEL